VNAHTYSSISTRLARSSRNGIECNTNRPHTSLNGLTPTEFATRPTGAKPRTDYL
jgi:putative transposase